MECLKHLSITKLNILKSVHPYYSKYETFFGGSTAVDMILGTQGEERKWMLKHSNINSPYDVLKLVEGSNVPELDELASFGFSFKKTPIPLAYVDKMPQAKIAWVIKNIVISPLHTTYEQLRKFEDKGWLPCFGEIPHTLNYLWLVDHKHHRDLLAEKEKEIIDTSGAEKRTRKDLYLNNLRHNKDLFAEYKHILWTNNKEAIPETVKELEALGYEVRGLSEDLHVPENRQHILQTIVEDYNREVSATFIDTTKLLIMETLGGGVVDLNYHFDRAFANSELNGGLIVDKHRENSMQASVPHHPSISKTLDEIDEKVFAPRRFDLIRNNRNFVFHQLQRNIDNGQHIRAYDIGSDNKFVGDKITYYDMPKEEAPQQTQILPAHDIPLSFPIKTEQKQNYSLPLSMPDASQHNISTLPAKATPAPPLKLSAKPAISFTQGSPTDLSANKSSGWTPQEITAKDLAPSILLRQMRL